MCKYIFGPVPSRRLGISLGIDVIPFKTCTLNCLYCECGKTTKKNIKRERFFPPDHLIREIRSELLKKKPIDHISFSGSGEPTLNSDLGSFIKKIKELSDIPIAVITNGTLLWKEDVRDDLLMADKVLPSLDAVTPETFKMINRPHPGLELDMIKEGIRKFASKYKGELWFEVFLSKGINDSVKEMEKMHSFLRELNPAKVQLNSLDRPPAFSGTKKMKYKELEKIRMHWSDLNVEIIKRIDTRNEIPAFSSELEKDIISTVSRRPLTIRDLEILTAQSRETISRYIDILEKEKKIKTVVSGDKIFYSSSLLYSKNGHS